MAVNKKKRTSRLRVVPLALGFTGVALSASLIACGGPKQLREAAELKRHRWDHTQARLRELYPPVLRDAGIGGVPTIVAKIDSVGVPFDPVLENSSGHSPIDEAALEGITAFRYIPPVAQGPYRIRVPFHVDSLMPTRPDECFSRPVLVALVRGMAREAVVGSVHISDWSFDPVDAAGRPKQVIPHRLHVTASETVEARCSEVLASWIPSAADSISSGKPGLTVCASGRCEPDPQPEREYTIRIDDFRRSWDNDWTFEMVGGGFSTGSWTIRCEAAESGCSVVRRPPRPIT